MSSKILGTIIKSRGKREGKRWDDSRWSVRPRGPFRSSYRRPLGCEYQRLESLGHLSLLQRETGEKNRGRTIGSVSSTLPKGPLRTSTDSVSFIYHGTLTWVFWFSCWRPTRPLLSFRYYRTRPFGVGTMFEGSFCVQGRRTVGVTGLRKVSHFS